MRDRAQPRRRRDHAVRSRDSGAESRRTSARDASERSVRWLARCSRAAFAASSTRVDDPAPRTPRAGALPRSSRAASTPTLRREAARAHPRHGRLGRLRHRRTLGRRGQARHVPHARGRARGAARATARATSWASAFPEDLVEGVAPRRRPLRLRRAHAHGTQRHGVHPRRPAEHQARRVPHRPAAARRATATAPPARRFSRAYIRHLFVADEIARAAPAVAAQCTFPRVADARRARARSPAARSTRGASDGSTRYHLDPYRPHDAPCTRCCSMLDHRSNGWRRRWLGAVPVQFVLIIAHLLLHPDPSAAEAAEEAGGSAARDQAAATRSSRPAASSAR